MIALEGARILVTGASGRIGVETCRRLTENGALITALSSSANPVVVADRVVVGDTRSESDVATAIEGADFLVHLAAMPHRDAGPGLEVYSNNVVSTYNVLAQAGALGITRAVVAGSINRYGLPQSIHPGLVPAYFPIDTDIPIDISDWYSLSKLNDENTSRMAWRHWGIDVITLRFPHVNTAEALVRQSDQLRADPRAGLTEAWSYLDVRDAARSIELSLVSDARGANAFFLAADKTNAPYRTDELLKRFAPLAPRTRPFVDREVPLDLTPARRLIGFRAQHELELDSIDLPDQL